ncbi:MAG: hypothetical protein WD063_18975 [Pirellulales bacterium]
MKRLCTWCVLSTAALVSLTSDGAAPRNDLSDFMRVKLKHSQMVLEGLVLGDFDRIAKNAQDMSLLSLAETWQVLQTPQYIEYSRKFRAAADALAEAAKKKNLDKAAEDYNRVTLRCVECHKYVRDVRMARAD